jgi:translocation and assembly module TamB
LRLVLAGLGVAVASLLLATLWMLGTVAGTGFALARLQSLLGGKLAIDSHAGTLAGPLALRGLRYDDPDAGVALTLREARVDVAVRRLLTGRVVVQDARFEGLVLRLSEPLIPPPEDDTPFTLDAPVDVVLRRLELRDAKIERDGAVLVDLRSALLSADWIGPELRLRQLDLLASDGEVHLAGRVREDGRYAGEANGRFRWQVGDRRFAGTLDALADADGTTATISLAEPVAATLALTLEQGGDWPWGYRLEVPRFDPRESLLPDSSLRQLAATLEGRGTLQAGTTGGQVELDGTRIDITRLAYARRETDWDLDGEFALGRGSLRLAGVVHGAAEPLAAELDVDWRDLDLPAALVGQALRTAGKLRVEGSSARYSADGALQLGPPGRLADIRVKLDGTPQRIRLEELAILQRSGRLAASGTVELPEAGPRWALTATARGFDPGEFFADWPGRLDFTLTTDGRIVAEQPQGRLVIRDLGGRLRGRRVAGQSDLRLAADRSMAGRLELRSGASRMTLQGAKGPDGRARAVLDLSVATLADWLPDAAGRVEADFIATGRWPAIEVTGTAVAGDLVSGDWRLAGARLDVSVTRPLDPRGRITLDARGLASGEFTADHLGVTADGDAANHRLELRLASPDVDVALDVGGTSRGDAWQGQLTRLDIAVPEVAKLSLQQPVALAYSPAAASLSEACLAEGDTRLCVAGNRRADGAFDGHYRVQALPLALATRLAAPHSPVGIDGLLDGDGDIRRDVAGRFDGRAGLRVAAARIEQWIDDEEPQLLRLADFSADATLTGTDGELTLTTRVDDDGRLTGRLAARGIGAAVTPLEGRLTLALPRLAVVEALLPQLTEVKGQLDIDATIGGTLDAPVPFG